MPAAETAVMIGNKVDHLAVLSTPALGIGGGILDLYATQIPVCIRINNFYLRNRRQNDVLKHLLDEDVEWGRINAFHMDEYIGLEDKFEKTFAYYLKTTIFDKVPLKSVNYVGSGDVDSVCKRYTELLSSRKIDVVLCGIGENAHLAFNDPPVADFNDPTIIKAVKLDEVCRNQQVNDGCFARLEDVPKTAITLTVPTLFAGDHLFCIVPAKTKAKAVCATLCGEIGEACPATVLRRHPSAVLYLDGDSSSLL